MNVDKKVRVFSLKKELFFIRTSILTAGFKKNSLLRFKRLEIAKTIILK